MSDPAKSFHNVKTFKELFMLPSKTDLDLMAAVPALMFLISPAVYFVQIAVYSGWRYDLTVTMIRVAAVILSLIVMSCHFAQLVIAKRSLKSIVSDHRPHFWFLIMAVLMIISTLLNGFTIEAMTGDFYRAESLTTFLCYIICFFGCASMIRYERTKRFLLDSFLVSSSFISVMALLDLSGILPVWFFHFIQEKDTMTAVFFQYNHFGYYLAIATTVSFAMYLYEKKTVIKILYLLSTALHAFTLIANNTRGCYLACFGAVVVTCVVFLATQKGRRRAVLPVLAVLAAGFAAGFLAVPQNFQRFMKLFRDVSDITSSSPDAAGETAQYAGTGRWLLWKLTVGAILEKPVFGWGTEGIRVMLAENSIDGNNRPHNEYLQYAVFYGIPAGLVYIFAIVSIYRKAVKKIAELSPSTVVALLGACAYLISACFGNTMFYTAPFLFILLGMGFQSAVPEAN